MNIMSHSPFQADTLKNQVALITGGGSGICLGVVRSLGLHGAKVAIMGRNLEKLQQACSELEQQNIDCYAVQGDVRDPELCQNAIDQTIKHFGGLNILVNGAAGNFLCAPEDLSPNGFKTVIDIDLCGTFNMCHFAYPHLKGQGLILNISATLHYTGTPFQLHVSAAKAGIDALTLNLATEWGADGIRVCGIAPGPIGDTEGMKRLAPPQILEQVKESVPLKRFGSVEDIGIAAVFLASSAAHYITGETLVVDGGQWASKPAMIPKELVKQMSQANRKK